MTGTLLTLLVVIAIVAGVVWSVRRSGARRAAELADARAEARRWVERRSGQVLSLEGGDTAARQALADASERFTAAGSQLEQASSFAHCRQVTETAYEGLYYVRAARTAMGLDPGPELPALPGQQRAGAVTESREIELQGHHFRASPSPSRATSHYYPGGTVAGRPVPAGWYSEPWWKTALVAGAWGVGSYLLFDALFSGMDHTAYTEGFSDGAQAMDDGDPGGWDSGATSSSDPGPAQLPGRPTIFPVAS